MKPRSASPRLGATASLVADEPAPKPAEPLEVEPRSLHRVLQPLPSAMLSPISPANSAPLFPAPTISSASAAAVPERAPKRARPDPSLCCPICLDIIAEAFMTTCGHSFCYSCISDHLGTRPTCPVCTQPVARHQLFPNFHLTRLVEEWAGDRWAQPSSATTWLADAARTLATDDADEIRRLLVDLEARAAEREVAERAAAESNRALALELLLQTRREKLAQLSKLTREVERLAGDVAVLEQSSTSPLPVSLAPAKRERVQRHAAELQQAYFGARPGSEPGLPEFQRTLSDVVRFSGFRVAATLRLPEMFNTSATISAIEFDKDDRLFATAGVARRVRVFDYASAIAAPTGSVSALPVADIPCKSKIASLSWSAYVRPLLALGDYDGVVSLCNTERGIVTSTFDEHERRVWSVDFSPLEPSLLASGSDDATVKVWDMGKPLGAVHTLKTTANVCTVRFSPFNAQHLIFGSADHHIYYYDLRSLREPLHVLRGHRKAVSYVRFVSRDELLSASTDSTLKLWDLGRASGAPKTFSGHENEKNFVGLSARSDFFCTGSETNSVFVYHRAISTPLLSHRFGAPSPLLESGADDDTGHFVSAVCWRRTSNTIVAGNSQGMLKILELV
eukprot:TRINITY_DN8013_c0_g1_i2.p1 TRINITY_DN8013_c0_g1~~TRINITY_DN8013_c0_g1_i2.p1  ORF type:complete len:634 (+),score=111.33 TRINITY_DN8013_c0_g1_i2:38-1903(+)